MTGRLVGQLREKVGNTRTPNIKTYDQSMNAKEKVGRMYRNETAHSRHLEIDHCMLKCAEV